MDVESDEASYTMLDVLAFNCTELQENLSKAEPNKIEELIMTHLEKTESLHPPITDFKEDSDWFNVTEPLSFSDSLKGKLVVLDFFTYCCINCMHVLPDLKKIEQLYTVEDGLLIIGVHSAKFDNEKDSSNILSAIQRYDITHPVVNDANSLMWNELNIQCWPTLLILGPNANPLFVLMGEGQYDLLKKYVSTSLRYFKKKNAILQHSLPLNPATELFVVNNLKFPGKIVGSKKNYNDDCAELYAISDSGNNRILIINSLGVVLQKVGGKLPGFIDGDFKTSRFSNPQGLDFLNDDILFVADTDNHAIRKIDLKQKTVETIVGNGRQGFDRFGGKEGRSQEISSPWDLCLYKTKDMDMSFHMDESTIPERYLILIAMAGNHQVWALFLEDVIWWKYKKYTSYTCAAIAGNGVEENRNNSYPMNASFAQPSGISISKSTKELFIADSESSSIRKMSLADGKVMPVAGGDRNPVNLFAYGDVDGKLQLAKFQHPLAVAVNEKEGAVYVADTYNHKIKKIDIKTSSVSTCKIFDQSNNEFQFNEPGGLCMNPSGDILYVADTNNHSIEIIDLHSMKRKALSISFDMSSIKRDLGQILEFPQLKIKPSGGKLRLSITLNLVDLHFTESAPQKWNVFLPNENWYINQQNGIYKQDDTIELDITVPPLSISVSPTPDDDAANSKLNDVFLAFKLNFCSNNICFPKLFSVKFQTLYMSNGLDCIIEEACIKVAENSVTL